MAGQLPTIPGAPIPKRRGRPPGSGNKRSVDLAKYLEATFAGATPGVQAAQVSMCTPAEIRRARADAKALGIKDLGLQPIALAMVVKAHKLAKALGHDTTPAGAWSAMQREREGLMAYVHQKQAPKADKGEAAQLPLVIMMEDGADVGAAIDFAEADPDEIEFMEEIPTP